MRFSAPVPGKGKDADHRCWSGRNPGPSSGQTKTSSALTGRPSHCSVTASGSACQVLSRGEEASEVLRQGVDLIGTDEPVQEDPAVPAPRFDFGVSGSP